MRLEELRLIAYGPFTDCTLKLQPGLNVLYGPNEAGKSSALRAVHALLFGVDERTNDNFVHSYQQMRIGGVMVDALGERLECVRRKGRRSTLRDGDDDQPIDEGLLRAMLGGVNEEFFNSVFGIDHERLREGGEEVVRGEGRIGELLFAAGGVAHLREKQLSLECAALELFKPSGRYPRINAALAQLRQLNNDIRQLQQSPEVWASHDAEHRRLSELEEKLRRDLEEAESTKSRLDRIYKALGFVATWKAKRSELDTLADVVALPADAEERFRQANEKRTLAEAAKKKAEKRVEDLQTEFEKLDVPTALLSEASRIDELYRRLGNHEKDVADSTVLAGQCRTARDNAKRTNEKLGWSLSLEDAAGRRLADEKKARVRALASRHGEVTQGKTRQQQLLERMRSRLAELKEQLANEPTVLDPVSLKDALEAATPALEVEDRLDEQRDEVQRIVREANDAIARLPLWEGSLEEACQLEVPSDETVDRFDKTSRELASQQATLTEQRELNEAEREQVRQDLAALELAESVPTEEELVTRREIRDRGVRMALQQLNGEEIDSSAVNAFVHEVEKGTNLASSLEPSVRQADEVADRLRRESNRVAHKSQLVAQLQALYAKTERLNAKSAKADEQYIVWDAEWKQCWEASGVEPSTPSEMRGWLRKHAELVEFVGELASATERLSREENRVTSLRESLVGDLSRQDVEAPDDANLRQLIQTGQRRVQVAETAFRSREKLEMELARVDDETEQAEKDLAAADEELNSWLSDWAEALQPLQLKADALPEQAEAVLGNLDELFRNLDEAEGFRTRILGIEQTAKEFTQAARDVASAVAPDLAKRPVEEVASTLNQSLSEAKQIRQQAESLEGRLESEKQAVEDADCDLADGTAGLDSLVSEAACGGLAELPAAIEKSRRKKVLEGDLDELQSQLAPLCAGRILGELVEDADREDADRLPTRIEELDSQIDSLREQLEGAIAAKEREAGILVRYDGSAAAAEKAEERQSVLARLEDDAREYAVATVASRLLQRAVYRYQEKAQGPVLAGASDHFRKLTSGSFDGLRTDYDESGEEVLVGVRPSGGTLAVEAMSEGSRDQLYLALRLGTLDHWFERHEPIPFIVDDVLLTFDDVRATAALETLVAMSERNQVLFFTHHEHLVNLSRDACRKNGGDRLHVVTRWDT